MIRLALAFLAAVISLSAFAQGTIQQAGPVVSRHSLAVVQNGMVGDAGFASGFGPNNGAGLGIAEQLLIAPSSPSGPLGTNWCDYSAPVTTVGGYYGLCLSPLALGGGLISYSAYNGAIPLPLSFVINGVPQSFIFSNDNRLPATPQTQVGWAGFGNKVACQVTTTSGQNTLHISGSGCTFAANQSGWLLVVDGAGTPASTGGIASIAVATPGSGYASIPTVGLSGVSGGQFAVLTPLMITNSATVNAGGSGCTTGLQTFTVSGGSGTSTTITGTVSGGALSGSLVIATAGSYQVLPTLTGVALTGGGCSVAPTANLNVGVGTIQISGGGHAYPTAGVTASLSGGSPSVAATLGTVSVTATRASLATKIQSYTGPNDIVMAASAGASNVAQTLWVTWAPDNYAAIQAALNSGQAVYFPSNGTSATSVYGTSQQLEIPASAGRIYGDGKETSIVTAMTSINAVFHKSNSGFWTSEGRSMSGLGVDGDFLATYAVEDGSDEGLYDFDGMFNALTADFHSAAGGGGYWFRDDDLESRNAASNSSDPGMPLPSYVLYVQGTDSHYSRLIVRNAYSAYVHDISAGNNFYHEVHAYGYTPQYHFDITSFAILEAVESDGWTSSASIHIGGQNVKVIGGLAQNNSPVGVLIDSGATNCAVVGFDANSASGANKIVNNSGDTTCIVENNPGAFSVTGQSRQNGSFGRAFGKGAKADGQFSFAQGQFAWSQGTGSVTLGDQSLDRGAVWKFTFPPGRDFTTQGDDQTAVQQLSINTTDNTTPKRLATDFSNAGSANSVNIPAKGVFGFWARCNVADSSANSGIYEIKGGYENSSGGGSLTWVGGTPPTFSTVAQDAGASGYVLTIALDNTNNALNITGTGGPALYRCSVWTEELVHS